MTTDFYFITYRLSSEHTDSFMLKILFTYLVRSKLKFIWILNFHIEIQFEIRTFFGLRYIIYIIRT